jgi:hypothetical protein
MDKHINGSGEGDPDWTRTWRVRKGIEFNRKVWEARSDFRFGCRFGGGLCIRVLRRVELYPPVYDSSN